MPRRTPWRPGTVGLPGRSQSEVGRGHVNTADGSKEINFAAPLRNPGECFDSPTNVVVSTMAAKSGAKRISSTVMGCSIVQGILIAHEGAPYASGPLEKDTILRYQDW